VEYQKKDRLDGANIQSVLKGGIRVEVKEASFCLCTMASLSSNTPTSKKLTNLSAISKYLQVAEITVNIYFAFGC